jgi:hypothetical protein
VLEQTLISYFAAQSLRGTLNHSLTNRLHTIDIGNPKVSPVARIAFDLYRALVRG